MLSKLKFAKMGLFLVVYFYLFIWRLKLFLLSNKRKIESQEFKVFTNFMKVDFRSFLKRCFSVFSRDTKRREFDVILNTKTKYFSNYYKMNSLISLKVVSLLHKLHCLQYTFHKGWKPIYCLAKWEPFLKYFLTSIFNLVHHPTLLSRGCNRNIHFLSSIVRKTIS